MKLLLDVDGGMHRSGVAPGPRGRRTLPLDRWLPGLRPPGCICTTATPRHGSRTPYAPLRRGIRISHGDAGGAERSGLRVPAVVVGGTPTFPLHAKRADVECSPGTAVFWDWGYTTRLPDMDFLPAALVLTRVISKPATNLLCLDLGHKAIASENPHPRVQLWAWKHHGGRPQRGTPGARNRSRSRVSRRVLLLRHAMAYLPDRRPAQRSVRRQERPGRRALAGRGAGKKNQHLTIATCRLQTADCRLQSTICNLNRSVTPSES